MSKRKKKLRFALPKLSKGAKIGLGVAGAGLLVLLLGKKSKANSGLLSESFLDSQYQPRGIKNNNPGNILYNPNNAWAGKIPYDQNTDGKFEQFKSYAYGVRAMIVLIKNYFKSLNTVRGIVMRWNKGNENYINFVAQSLQVSADVKLTPNKATIKALVLAIANFENGVSIGDYPAISDDMFETAWSLQ
jgi:hypothetical protein